MFTHCMMAVIMRVCDMPVIIYLYEKKKSTHYCACPYNLSVKNMDIIIKV